MNSGWMNLGWNFLYLFLTMKIDDMQCAFFHMAKEGILTHYRMNFKIWFWSIYEFLIIDGWIQGMTLIYLWGMILIYL